MASITCTRVSPTSNKMDVPFKRDLIIACLIGGIKVNVGHSIMAKWKEYVKYGPNKNTLIFPSLISELCRKANVPERIDDGESGPYNEIHPLKGRGGGSSFSKKRKESDDQASTSSQPSPTSGRPLVQMSTNLAATRQLISELPRGLFSDQPDESGKSKLDG